MNRIKVLLLGGSGTLSTAILNEACSKGFDVSVFNRGNNNGKLPNFIQKIRGDFKKTDDLQNILIGNSYDIVVDFLSRIPSDIERVYPIFANQIKQYIFISSACVYRRGKEDFPITEDSPKPNIDWNYNIEKYECEKRLIALSDKFSSSYTIVRPYITYDAERIPFGLAPTYKYHRTIIERILNNKPMFVWDDGKTLTTSTFVDEFAKGCVGLFLNPKAKNEDFHITSECNYPIKEVLLQLYQSLDKEPNIVSFTSDEIGETLPNYKSMLKGDRSLPAIFDNSKIKDAVPNLKFTFTLKEGITRILEYYNKSDIYEYDYQYDAQIDRLLSTKGHCCHFSPYKNGNSKKRVLYYIYRYFPYNMASFLCRKLRIS